MTQRSVTFAQFKESRRFVTSLPSHVPADERDGVENNGFTYLGGRLWVELVEYGAASRFLASQGTFHLRVANYQFQSFDLGVVERYLYHYAAKEDLL